MIHVYVAGFVQGVGFRQFVKNRSRDLNISGWVKNLDDGRLEAVFQGEKKNLDLMIEECRKGPFLADVKDLKIEEIPDVEFESFEIIK